MQKRLYIPFWHRLFCLLMAFYVLNVSIDAPDGYVKPDSRGEYHEDLSFNEIESFSELVLEDVFDFKNAVPERDESDEEEDQISKIFFDWSMPTPSVYFQFLSTVGYISTKVLPVGEAIYGSSPAEINTPPPQAV
jgi:hypothetical protein